MKSFREMFENKDYELISIWEISPHKIRDEYKIFFYYSRNTKDTISHFKLAGESPDIRIKEERYLSTKTDSWQKTFLSEIPERLLDYVVEHVINKSHDFKEIFIKVLHNPLTSLEEGNIHEMWIPVFKRYKSYLQNLALKNLGHTDTDNTDIL